MADYIAVLGTGLMGAPMARRLLTAGFQVTAWNRTRAKAEALVQDGAHVVDAAAKAAACTDIVLTMLENGAVVTDVLFGQGVADALSDGALVIDMSSIPPSVAKDHAARLGERGIRYIDAPVSGGVVGAEQGTLAIMAGGARKDIERAAQVFAAMGRVTPVGPSGAGQLAKLANQAIVGITIGAVSESLLLAAAGGADPAAVRQAIRGGFAESRILELHGQRMVDRNFVPGGTARVQLKDMETIVETAEGLSLDLPLTRNIRDRYRRLVDDLGDGMLDHSALLLELEARNVPARVGAAADTRP
ncbi:MAG: NAD(P)-dependent oxidoreductase [Pseudomonadota bacterium]